jgi:DNA damage-binding protein 2
MRRYISEDFGGVALHPVDIMDASTGRLLTQLVDANLATICPVNKPHPRLDVIISGSSRSLYAWRPADKGARAPWR